MIPLSLSVVLDVASGWGLGLRKVCGAGCFSHDYPAGAAPDVTLNSHPCSVVLCSTLKIEYYEHVEASFLLINGLKFLIILICWKMNLPPPPPCPLHCRQPMTKNLESVC